MYDGEGIGGLHCRGSFGCMLNRGNWYVWGKYILNGLNAMWNRNKLGGGCYWKGMYRGASDIWGHMHRRDGFGCILNRGYLVFVR